MCVAYTLNYINVAFIPDCFLNAADRTCEGTTGRRPMELKLLSSTMPVIAMNWTVTHVIDRESPLYPHLEALGYPRDDDVEAPSGVLRGPDGIELIPGDLGNVDIMALFSGEDSVQREKLHATHVYHVADFVGGAVFRDMVEMDGGAAGISLAHLRRDLLLHVNRIHEYAPIPLEQRLHRHCTGGSPRRASTAAQTAPQTRRGGPPEGPTSDSLVPGGPWSAAATQAPPSSPAVALVPLGGSENLLSPASMVHNLSTLDASTALFHGRGQYPQGGHEGGIASGPVRRNAGGPGLGIN